jgi:Protein of unknown function (DUF3592)
VSGIAAAGAVLLEEGMKTIAVIKYLFSGIGLAMLAAALFWYQSVKAFVAGASVAQGTVVELVRSQSGSDSPTYRPVVRFNASDGQAIEFTSKMGSNPPSYRKGEKVEVFYKPADPQNAMINGFFSLWGGPVIVGGLGAVFFLVGGGIWLFARLKGQRDEYLMTHGTPIQTKFQSVELNNSLTVNGANPFRVVTQWQDPATSELHVFKSNNLWFDPSDYIKQRQITVFIEANNPKKYFVDLSFLPKLAS